MLEDGTQPVYKPPLKDLHIPIHANATSIPTFFFFLHIWVVVQRLCILLLWLDRSRSHAMRHLIENVVLWKINGVRPELSWAEPLLLWFLPALTPSWLTACHQRKTMNCKLLKAFSAGELIVSDCTLWGQIGASQVVKRRNDLEKENRSSLPAGLNLVPVTGKGPGSTFNIV